MLLDGLIVQIYKLQGPYLDGKRGKLAVNFFFSLMRPLCETGGEVAKSFPTRLFPMRFNARNLSVPSKRWIDMAILYIMFRCSIHVN